MAVSTFERASEVTRGVTGDSDTRRHEYIVKLTAPENEPDNTILVYVSNNTGPGAGEIPGSWDGLPRRKIDIKQLGPIWFVVSVSYGYQKPSTSTPETGTVVQQFSVTPKTFKARIAHEQSKYKITGDGVPEEPEKNEFGNFIQVRTTKDARTIEGDDALVPSQEFTLRYTNLTTFFNTTIMASAMKLSTKVNDDTWYGFEKGTLMFMGVSGDIDANTSDGKTTISYRFAYQENKPAQEIAGIEIGPSYGWEKVWVEEKENPNPNLIGLFAKAVFVYRDFEWGDFSVLPI